jgi:hypothetical protein
MPRHLRPRHVLRRPLLSAASAGTLVLLGVAFPPGPVQADGTCSVSGTAFVDSNRNGALDVGEAGRSGDTLYLFDDSGTVVAGTTTASDGTYTFAQLACATYSVSYETTTWWGIRGSMVPTTTGSLLPRRTLALTGAGRADFGWRPIVRSTTAGSPINSYTGPQGLKVESYDDVVPAKDIYDNLLRGTTGPEAATVTVRFDITPSSMTNSSIGATNGVYDSFSATVNVDWMSWLTQSDNALEHEYGHAWTTYRTYLDQQDPTGQAYLKARGLAGDSRVGSTYAWYVSEMMAEDYRQLLGTTTSASYSQMNSEIPPAASVPGLRDFLLGAFSTPPGSSPSPSPSPTASPSPSPSPTATAATTPKKRKH